MQMAKEEQPAQSLENKCGIISSCYPPTEMYPDGLRVEYPFAVSPKDTDRYIKN